MAKAIATGAKLNFLAVKGPELFRKWVGDSEKQVAAVFRRARQVDPKP
jgi:SpoVK/Ycf46/Vps4 family AAA+-type ATPase